MANFIKNADDKDLRKGLVKLVENSTDLKFLVGFFYFSGIRELYKGNLLVPPSKKYKQRYLIPRNVITILDVSTEINQWQWRLDAAARTAGAFQFEEQQEPLLEREIGVMWIGGLFSQSFPKSGQAGSLSLAPDLNETFLVMNGGVLTQVH